jgi:hypothetical protein
VVQSGFLLNFDIDNCLLKKFHYTYVSFQLKFYSRVKNGLLPRILTFREITFFMLCVTRIFKSYFECLRLVILN